MKEKLHYVIEAVLAVAVIILFVLQFSGDRKSVADNALVKESVSASESPIPIAFIDLDSLMSNYTYFIDLTEQIAKKYENSHASITEKFRKLQSDIDDYKRKVETGSFLTQERMEAEQQRIMARDRELQELQAKMSQELAEEQARINEELRNTIVSHLREFNKGKGFHIVYGKINDNILYADDAYNITGEVIDYLNKQHASSPAAKTDE
ncbi:MAG: OmpH family outer membrane protein [Tannerella sp.]|jgi:outer membrane protein|nr:OmpH family outer membrane protein [Tannerella sp.]